MGDVRGTRPESRQERVRELDSDEEDHLLSGQDRHLEDFQCGFTVFPLLKPVHDEVFVVCVHGIPSTDLFIKGQQWSLVQSGKTFRVFMPKKVDYAHVNTRLSQPDFSSFHSISA
jgi:hypothetical protein